MSLHSRPTLRRVRTTDRHSSPAETSLQIPSAAPGQSSRAPSRLSTSRGTLTPRPSASIGAFASNNKTTTSVTPKFQSCSPASPSPRIGTPPSAAPDSSKPASTASQSKWCEFKRHKGSLYSLPPEIAIRSVAAQAVLDAMKSSADPGQLPDPDTFASKGKLDKSCFTGGPGNMSVRFEYTGDESNGSRPTTNLDLFVRDCKKRPKGPARWELEERLSTHHASDKGESEITHHFRTKTDNARYMRISVLTARKLNDEIQGFPDISSDSSDSDD